MESEKNTNWHDRLRFLESLLDIFAKQETVAKLAITLCADWI